MSTQNSTIPVLVEDILIKILCSCDIATVVTAGMANRNFHSLCLSKHVWLALLCDLNRRGFIDLAPNQRLEDLSKDELLDLAKRTVHGPKTWASSDPTESPVIARQVMLRPIVDRAAGALTREVEPEVLPGGRFSFFRNGWGLECRSTMEDRVIWEYKGRWISHIQEYSAEMIEGGRAVTLLLGIRTYEPECKKYVDFLEIVRLDLDTGLSTSLYRKDIPATSYDNPFRRLRLLGDFAVASMMALEWLILIQISTGSLSILLAQSDRFDFDLIPGHVLVLQRGATPNPHVRHFGVWNSQALIERNTQYEPLDTIKPAVDIAIDVSAVYVPDARLVSHLSPLSDDTSTIWAVFSAPSNLDRSLIYKYRAVHSQAQGLSIVHISSWGRLDNVRCHALDGFSISYAGFMLLHHGQLDEILSLAGRSKTVCLPDRDRLYMSTYSGALIYATRNRVVINYYE